MPWYVLRNMFVCYIDNVQIRLRMCFRFTRKNAQEITDDLPSAVSIAYIHLNHALQRNMLNHLKPTMGHGRI